MKKSYGSYIFEEMFRDSWFKAQKLNGSFAQQMGQTDNWATKLHNSKFQWLASSDHKFRLSAQSLMNSKYRLIRALAPFARWYEMNASMTIDAVVKQVLIRSLIKIHTKNRKNASKKAELATSELEKLVKEKSSKEEIEAAKRKLDAAKDTMEILSKGVLPLTIVQKNYLWIQAAIAFIGAIIAAPIISAKESVQYVLARSTHPLVVLGVFATVRDSEQRAAILNKYADEAIFTSLWRVLKKTIGLPYALISGFVLGSMALNAAYKIPARFNAVPSTESSSPTVSEAATPTSTRRLVSALKSVSKSFRSREMSSTSENGAILFRDTRSVSFSESSNPMFVTPPATPTATPKHAIINW